MLQLQTCAVRHLHVSYKTKINWAHLHKQTISYKGTMLTLTSWLLNLDVQGGEKLSGNFRVYVFSCDSLLWSFISEGSCVLFARHQAAITLPAHCLILVSSTDHLHLQVTWRFQGHVLVKPSTLCGPQIASSPPSLLRSSWCKQLLCNTACRQREASRRSLLEGWGWGCFQMAEEWTRQQSV